MLKGYPLFPKIQRTFVKCNNFLKILAPVALKFVASAKFPPKELKLLKKGTSTPIAGPPVADLVEAIPLY